MRKDDLESWLKTPKGVSLMTSVRAARRDKDVFNAIFAGRKPPRDSVWGDIVGHFDPEERAMWRERNKDLFDRLDQVIGIGETIERCLAGRDMTKEEHEMLDQLTCNYRRQA